MNSLSTGGHVPSHTLVEIHAVALLAAFIAICSLVGNRWGSDMDFVSIVVGGNEIKELAGVIERVADG